MGTLTGELLKKQKVNDWFSSFSENERDRLCEKYNFPKLSTGQLLNIHVEEMYNSENL